MSQAVRKVSVNTNIEEAEDRIRSLGREYVNALRSSRYAHILETKPHIAINHILKRLKPPQLYRRMQDIIIWRKNDNFHEENFDRFIREVAVQAEKLQTDHRGLINHDLNLKRRNIATRKKAIPLARRNIFKAKTPAIVNHKLTENNNDTSGGKKRKRCVSEASLCLNSECKAQGKRPYINNCDISDKNIKIASLEEYHHVKRARTENARRGSGNVARVSHHTANPHSYVFRASLGNGAVETNLMADQGTDANFISACLFKEIQQKVVNLEKKSVQPPNR